MTPNRLEEAQSLKVTSVGSTQDQSLQYAQSFWVCRCLGLGFPHLMIFAQSPRRMGCSQMTSVSFSLGAANQLVVVGGSYL